jgi:hypothetical protein
MKAMRPILGGFAALTVSVGAATILAFPAAADDDSDTYGSPGIGEYLRENKQVYPNASDDVLIELGNEVCNLIRQGYTTKQVYSLFERKGASAFLVDAAQMFICPGS